jgi:hypothetical protein
MSLRHMGGRDGDCNAIQEWTESDRIYPGRCHSIGGFGRHDYLCVPRGSVQAESHYRGIPKRIGILLNDTKEDRHNG